MNDGCKPVSLNSCSLKPNVRTSKPCWPAVPAATNAPESSLLLLFVFNRLGSNPLSVCAGIECGPAWISPWTEFKDVSLFE